MRNAKCEYENQKGRVVSSVCCSQHACLCACMCVCVLEYACVCFVVVFTDEPPFPLPPLSLSLRYIIKLLLRLLT